jgi:uncharacterized membrane protein YphA (DoxX/SURF4 family)
MSPTSLRRAGYWVATSVTALVFASGGAAYVAGAETPLRGMAELGYPSSFVTLLGFWKLAGGLAIVAPRLPRLKEWAYAGIAFDLTGAAFSHLAMGHPAAKIVVPLVFLMIAGASWILRPSDRRLDATHAEPSRIFFRRQALSCRSTIRDTCEGTP